MFFPEHYFYVRRLKMVYLKTTSTNSDFVQLVKLLDEELKITDGDEHAFYDQFNKITAIKHVILAYSDTIAVGCGAIKEYSSEQMEIKRMFVLPEQRGKGIASLVLAALENWAKELGYQSCILETGSRQKGAIALYKKNNYEIIPNYGQYQNVANSICFEKRLI